MRVFGDVLPFCSLGFGGGLVAPNHAESRVQHDRGVSALDSRTGHSQRGGSRLPPLLCCQRGLRFFVGIQYWVLNLCGLACARRLCVCVPLCPCCSPVLLDAHFAAVLYFLDTHLRVSSYLLSSSYSLTLINDPF